MSSALGVFTRHTVVYGHGGRGAKAGNRKPTAITKLNIPRLMKHLKNSISDMDALNVVLFDALDRIATEATSLEEAQELAKAALDKVK